MPVTQRIRCFNLPGLDVGGNAKPLRYGEVELEVPHLSPAQLRRAIAQASGVSATRLRSWPVSKLLEPRVKRETRFQQSPSWLDV